MPASVTTTSSGPVQRRTNAPPRRARGLLIVLVLAGVLGFTLSPWLQRKSGIGTLDRWFLDSYAVLAASDAVQAGIDPTKTNPLDVLQRPHSYSDWWYVLGRIGLDRSDNFLVGGGWVLAFLAVTLAVLRPRNVREAFWFALLALSPPMLLAIVRANNDLVIFVLLGMGAIALRRPGRLYAVLGAIALGLATGLKFYPALAIGALVVLRPLNRMLLALALATAAVLAALSNVWPALGRGVFTLPPSPYTMGAPVIFRDLGSSGNLSLPIGVALIAVAAVMLANGRMTSGLGDSESPEPERLLFALGAIVLVGCFLAGASYAYRWVFALWLVPWLRTEATNSDLTAMRRVVARHVTALLLLILWLDGLFCFALNVFIGPMSDAARDRVQLGWRLMTQPLAWVLMALLAGWLLDAAVATWRELRHRSAPLSA